MSKSLVIVESPAKARTIARFLGDRAEVLASMGHVRDLPQASLGVDLNEDFRPAYVLTKNGKKVIKELKQAMRDAPAVYLATDPDREGEAIAWHLQEALTEKSEAPLFHRVSFHEITENAIHEAFDHPGELDHSRIDAQQARRVLDRLVGYQVSPLLWKHVQKGTSAGRVQSVALRLVCERERQILDFEPREYWNLGAIFRGHGSPQTFSARLHQVDGKKPDIGNADAAEAVVKELECAKYRVVKATKKPRRVSAAPPFITSTLQQAASSGLSFSTAQTMRIAQQLYEGVELGAEGATGLITYMRTDSVTIAKEAQEQARAYIAETFGDDFVPKKPNAYRSGKSAQEAHEAIRPTDVRRTPDSLAEHLSRPQLRLYRLVWNRLVASQMTKALFREHQLLIGAEAEQLTHAYTFQASVRERTFAGHQAVYVVKEADQDEETEATTQLPELSEGTACDLAELSKEQRFTEPPRRFSEATLVRELEQNGVGRPSTYATIVNTIQDRSYSTKEKGRLIPTTLGFSVNDYLLSHLPELFEVDFTARMEAQLDEIEEGRLPWTKMLSVFYETFRNWVSDGIILAAPSNEAVKTFIELFPENIDWAPPTKRGRRTYDDRAFVESLREQAERDEKRLSDKQWMALLGLAARYAEQVPGLLDTADELDVRPRLEQLIREVVKAGSRTAPPPSSDDLALVKALANVDWSPPVKRGRRTFNDGRFYQSIADQVKSGNALSDAQQASLKRLVVKYRKQVPGYAELSGRLGLETPEEPSGEEIEQTRALLDLAKQVNEWAEPRKRGPRVYDDKEFVDSLSQQFDQRGSLTQRQVGALRRTLGRYREQIPGYDDRAEELQLPGAPSLQPKPTGVKCPKCGEEVVERNARGRTFFGCSGFPKCRYTTRALPEAEEGETTG